MYHKKNQEEIIIFIHTKDEKIYSINEKFINSIWND